MKKLITDTLVLGLGGAINRAKGLILIPFLVGAIGLEGYGAFVQMFVLARMIGSLASLELSMGFQRLTSQQETPQLDLSRHFFTVLGPVMVGGILGGLLLRWGAPVLSRLFFDDLYVESLRIAAWVVPSSVLYSTVRNFFRARRQFKTDSLHSLAYDLLPYVGLVIGTGSTGGLVSGVTAYVVLDLAVSLTGLAVVSRRLTFTKPDLSLLKDYFRFSFPLALAYVQGDVLRRSGLFFVSFFLGLEAVAIFNVIHRVTDVITFISMPVQIQLLTYLSSIWDKGHVETSKQILRSALLGFSLIAVGTLAGLALYFDALFEVLLNKPAPPEPLWPMVALMGVGLIANTFRRFAYVLIRLEQTTHHELGYQFAGLLVGLTANAILVPSLGLLGAALAMALTYLALLPLIGARYPLEFDAGFIGHGLSFVMLALIVIPLRYAIPPVDLLHLLLSLSCAMASYFGLAIIAKRRLIRDLWRDLGEWKRLAQSAPSSA